MWVTYAPGKLSYYFGTISIDCTDSIGYITSIAAWVSRGGTCITSTFIYHEVVIVHTIGIAFCDVTFHIAGYAVSRKKANNQQDQAPHVCSLTHKSITSPVTNTAYTSYVRYMHLTPDHRTRESQEKAYHKSILWSTGLLWRVLSLTYHLDDISCYQHKVSPGRYIV